MLMLAYNRTIDYTYNMAKYYNEVAHTLIEQDKVVGAEAQNLFGYGHNLPFGSRWHMTTGFDDFVPTKKISRTMRLDTEKEIKKEEDRFRKMFITDRGNPNAIGMNAILKIFEGVPNLKIRASISPPEGLIVVTETPNQDTVPIPTTADFGRMMLIDDVVYDCWIGTSGSRMPAYQQKEVLEYFE